MAPLAVPLRRCRDRRLRDAFEVLAMRQQQGVDKQKNLLEATSAPTVG
jgi:hypothetical protein